MAKLTVSDFTSIGNETSFVTALNAAFTSVETAVENTLSLDGTTPNAMSADLDMNGNDILNLGSVILPTEAVDQDALVPTGGNAGDVLTKSSGDDFDMAWAAPAVSSYFSWTFASATISDAAPSALPAGSMAFDTAGAFSTDTYTAPRTAPYTLTWELEATASDATSVLTIYVLVNGAPFRTITITNPSDAADVIAGATTIYASINDAIQFQAYITGANLVVTAGWWDMRN